jgi:hypothetical protein
VRGYLTIALMALMTTGCVTTGREAARDYITAEGYERMAQAVTLSAKRDVVRDACIRSGLPEGTRRHARCVTGYFAMDAEIARARAAELRQRAASRNGYCIDEKHLSARRCLEI